MEERVHSGTFRLKSKVPRARFASRASGEFGDVLSHDYRNGASKNHSNVPGTALGMSSALIPQSQLDTDENKEWQRLLGERVCISGVKQGILRYYGRTNFAQGHWCGVELDEPVGKNNGTVNGVVYFHCKHNHGIFAPVSKVSKLNDLSGGDWRAELTRESHSQPPNLDYNVRYTPETVFPERKFIKTSRSDPTFLISAVRSVLPHNSESFPNDKRSITEQREISPHLNIRGKDAINFEVVEKCENVGASEVATNITPNPLSACVLTKYGYGRKNQFFSSNVVRLKSEMEVHEPVRNVFGKSEHSSDLPKRGSSSSATKLGRSLPQSSSFTAAREEYESFFLKTPTNSGTASPAADAKRYGDMPFLEDYRVPSSEKILNPFLSGDFQDEMLDDDDQMSVDFDESLGILTPSQMKDFTLCADQPTSCSDIRAMDFPSSESFDDINDLPEDEQVHDVSVHYLPESSSAVRSLEVSKQSNVGAFQKSIVNREDNRDENRVMVSSTNKFLFSISSKDFPDFNVDSHFSPPKSEITPQTSVQSFDLSHKTYSNYSTADVLKSNMTDEVEKKLANKFCVETNDFSSSCSGESSMNSKVIAYTARTNEMKTDEMSYCQYSTFTSSSDQVKTVMNQRVDSSPVSQNLSDNNKIKMIAMRNYPDDEMGKKNYDTDSSRDSLLQADQEHTASKEKLTVSWEDCVTHNTDCMFTPVERPESVYTVASNDTGYQEDGEYDGDAGMATSMDSTEGTKRFSTTSRDSCIVTEDVDGYKIAESNSTSGYSTGLSDSCCNDRPDDDSASGKPLTDESIQDSVGPCDSEDAFSLQENTSIPKESVVEISDLTETVTSDAICMTMVEDSTLTEIHELLMSPEEIPPDVTSPKDKEVQMEHEEIKIEDKSIVKANAKVETVATPLSSCKSTPEKKMANNNNRTKTTVRADLQRNQRLIANNVANKAKKLEEALDRKKQIVKSPKKNVMSKIKAMIEATSCKTISKNKPEPTEVSAPKRTVSAPKKSRWEAVTSKIAASLAEEKTKPKAKRDIKSKVDTNLTLARQQVTCKSPKLDSSRLSSRGDGSMSPNSVSSRDRRALVERNSAPSSLKEGRENQSKDMRSGHRSPRPGKPCITSRSTSPVAASESSTTSVSLTSHNSRSKIAHWKGSTSTVASSAAPAVLPAKKQVSTAPAIKQTLHNSRPPPPSRMVSKRPPAAPKIRSVLTVPNSVRSLSPSVASSSKADVPRVSSNYQQTRLSKEQGNSRSVHYPPPKPGRPPMWLSKAELTQEIQHLGNLCEARTKELNRLKMETKHVTVGFDAFAALFKYMVEDLNALSVPNLAEDLQKTLKQLELTKQDLAYYEREVEELKAHHCQELTDLSNKLFEAYQGEVAEIHAKHQEQLNHLKKDHQKEVENISTAFAASSEDIKTRHEKLITNLEQELIKQREELTMFHASKIKDLEEKHKSSTKALHDHIEQLQKKCAELKHHTMGMEDAMRKDTDSKLQWVTSCKVDLQKEVESLKAVLEMKNKELHSLRVQNLEMEKQLEDLPLAREKIKMLQARAEDLEALMAAKTKLERKLSTENQIIRETYEKESKVNKRLSMENEELQWRIRQTEHSLISGSFTEDPPEEDETVTSPAKSPAPHAVTRSVFFTFVDKDDADRNSPQSPGSQYKKINRTFSTNYKTSPGKTFKSPPAPSPRKAKSHSEPPPIGTGGTPRKVAKQPSSRSRVSQKRQRAGSEGGQLHQNSDYVTVCNDGNFLSIGESMASSASSESSVFEHKEKLLEEHKDQIMASLEILREQRSSEDAIDESGTTCDTEKNWCGDSSKVMSNSDVEDLSQSGEFTDPKTYYHMTFPVLRESGADCDMEDNKETSSEDSPVRERSTDKHSMPKTESPTHIAVQEDRELKREFRARSLDATFDISSVASHANRKSTETSQNHHPEVVESTVSQVYEDKAHNRWRTI